MTSKNTVIVVSAAVSQTGATFYTSDGKALTITAADRRVQNMIDQTVTAFANGANQVEVDLTTNTVFSEIEKKAPGLRFFRVAKTLVSKILGSRSDRGKVNEHGMVSSVPDKAQEAAQPGTEPVEPAHITALQKAHDDATSKALDDEKTTVVAVVNNTPIVGAEALAPHAEAAVTLDTVAGFEKFMERFAAMASKRKHSAQELLAFMKNVDLPIALDGSIIAYKSLTTTNEEGVWVDNHSKKLKQGLGTFVEMDVEMVDDNRRVLCSNGLHIARRKYLQHYGTGSGNVITLVKINPEDVIAVPMGEQDKMRVRAYHIVAQLTEKERESLSSGSSITSESDYAKMVIAKIIAGDHPPILNRTHQKKNGTIDQMVPVVQPIQKEKPAALPEPVPEVPKLTVDKVNTLNTEESGKDPNAKLDPAAINRKLGKVKEEPKKEIQKENKSQKPVNKVREAYNAWAKKKSKKSFEALMAVKKAAKKGWGPLGFSEAEIKAIEEYKG